MVQGFQNDSKFHNHYLDYCLIRVKSNYFECRYPERFYVYAKALWTKQEHNPTTLNMFRLWVVFSILGCGLPIARADNLAGPIPAEIIRVVDGDTVKVRATIWLDQTLVISVRLRGIDAPELFRPKCAAKKTLARSAKASVLASSPVGSHVTLTNISRGKYAGRVIASVTTTDGETLATRLLAQGQAIVMGTDKPWCTL